MKCQKHMNVEQHPNFPKINTFSVRARRTRWQPEWNRKCLKWIFIDKIIMSFVRVQSRQSSSCRVGKLDEKLTQTKHEREIYCVYEATNTKIYLNLLSLFNILVGIHGNRRPQIASTWHLKSTSTWSWIHKLKCDGNGAFNLFAFEFWTQNINKLIDLLTKPNDKLHKVVLINQSQWFMKLAYNRFENL